MAKRKRKQLEQIVTPTPEQIAQGGYKRGMVMHVETATGSLAFINRSNIVDRWFAEGWPGFEEPARMAINWCHERWEARGEIGNLSASYGAEGGGSGNNQYARDIELKDELDRVKAMFHPEHWRVFENVVRWGIPAGSAGMRLAKNTPQAIASSRATVGLVANYIAMKRGY